MGVGVDGQWYLDVSIDGKSFGIEDVTSLVVVEEVGNLAPTFELTASIKGLDILKKSLHTDSEVIIKLGPSPNEAFQYAFKLFELPAVPGMRSHYEHLATISGIRAGMEKYFYDTWVKSYADMPSTEVIDTITTFAFGKSATISHASNDKMTWINPGIPFRDFLDFLWMRGYRQDDSLYVPAIDLSGFLIYTDVIWRLKSGSPDLILTHAHSGGSNDPKVLEYTSPMLHQNTGFLGAYAGSGRKMGEWDLQGGTHKELTYKGKKAVANLAPVLSPYERRFAPGLYDEDNVHEKFNEGWLQNQTNLAFFSQVGGSVMIPNKSTAGDVEKRGSLLGKVTFLLENPDSQTEPTGESDTFFSGDYIISKIVRAYADSSYYEKYHFCREGFQQVG